MEVARSCNPYGMIQPFGSKPIKSQLVYLLFLTEIVAL